MMDLDNLDMTKDQHLMSIMKGGKELGDVEIRNNKIITEGNIGYNEYSNFVSLIYGLQGYDLSIDNFYF